MAPPSRYRRRLAAWRRRSYFSVARFRRNALGRRKFSYKRRKYGWTTARHSKSLRLIRLYSRSRRLTGAEIKYTSIGNATFTWTTDFRYAYSALLPNYITGMGHKIRLVYGAIHLGIPNSVPVRVLLIRHGIISSTDVSKVNPFQNFDSPLSTTTPTSTGPSPISFAGFYSTSHSGNIQVVFDKTYNVPDQGSASPTRLVYITFGRGYTVSFSDQTQNRVGRNFFQLCLIYLSNPGDLSGTQFPVRFAYTNVGG